MRRKGNEKRIKEWLYFTRFDRFMRESGKKTEKMGGNANHSIILFCFLLISRGFRGKVKVLNQSFTLFQM